MSSKKTVVLGASANPGRYSNIAVNKLSAYRHPVVAVGRREGNVDGIPVHKEKLQAEDIDTVTLYLNPQHQVEYYDYILGLKPKRIIFNPGTENEDLIKLAEENKIEPFIGCTLVMLSTGQY